MGIYCKLSVTIFLCLVFFAQNANAQSTYTVTNTADSGPGSFRLALQNANSGPNGSTIIFAIPSGPFVIQPLTSYTISKQVTINGLNASGKPGIEFDGSKTASATCFDMNSAGGSGTVFEGLVINNFIKDAANGAGITISKANAVTITKCYIGTDITGTIAKANTHGIWINGSSNNEIGGPTAADGNIIAGNTIRGVWVSAMGGSASNNTVENNTVGSGTDGKALSNYTGVEFQLNSINNLIQHNNISNNKGDGLSFNQVSSGNRVYGNVFTYNGEHGVDFLNSSVTNTVVGVDINGVGEPNEMGYNRSAGVFVGEWNSGTAYIGGAPSKITIRKNKIYCNGLKGIALSDSTAGARGNNNIASPIINPSSNEVKTFGTALPGAKVDIYVADACNACNSGKSQGQTYLTSITAAGDGIWSYTNATPGGALCNSLIVTATDAQGNTSEFASSCVLPIVTMRDTSTCSTLNLNLDVTQPCAYSYKWSTGATTGKVSIPNAAPGNYWVEVTGIDKKAVRANFTIKQNPSFTVNLGPDQFRCANPFSPVIVLDPNLPNSMQYLWSTGASTPTLQINKRGKYWVTVTDPVTKCSNSDTVEILPNVAPAPLLTNAAFCSGGSVTFKPGNFTTYLWSDNSTGSSLTTGKAGTYWVKVSSANGCTDSVSAKVTVHPKPTVTIPDQFICKGDQTTFTAPAFTSYLWSSGESTQSINVKAQGTYTVTVKDSNTCSNTASPKLTFFPDAMVQISPRDKSICQGESVLLDAGNKNVSYLWSSGEKSQTVKIATAGKYIVSVMNVNQCKAKDSVTIKMLPKDIANFSTSSYCEGTNATQPAFGPGNTPGGIFSFSTKVSDGATINTGNGSIGAGKGGTTYSIKYVTTGACKDSMVKPVSVLNNPVITQQPQDFPVCATTPAHFEIKANFTNTYQWQISTDGITFTDLTESAPYSGTATNYLAIDPVAISLDKAKFRCIARAGACESISNPGTILFGKNITISNPTAPPVCDSTKLTLTANAIGATTYKWQYSTNGISFQTLNDGGSYSNTQTPILTINPVTAQMDGYQFRCYASGCMNTDTSKPATITLLPNTKVITQPKNAVICIGADASFSVAAINYLTYQWYVSTNNGQSFQMVSDGSDYSGSTTNALVVHAPKASMDGATYYCLASGTCNSSPSLKVVLNVTDPKIVFNPPTPVCPGATITLTANSNYADATISWDNGRKQGNSIVETMNTEKTFMVKASKNGCSITVSKTITLIPIPIPVVRKDTVICPGEKVQLKVSVIPGYIYSWTSPSNDYSSSEPQPYVHPKKNTTYTIHVKNPVCPFVMTDTVRVGVIEDMHMYVPNAFTPNDDKLNDVFQVVGEGVKDFNATIFDRWGEIIYEWNSINGSWNGQIKGDLSLSQIEVFVYKIKATGTCNKDAAKPLVGTVTVVR
jgi:gliding motility-associated-like protein